MFIILPFLLLANWVYTSLGYNTQIASTAVWLSGAAYCGKSAYNTMMLGGDAQSVDIKKILYDVKTDLQGFIGVSSLYKQIYIVFRGSSSALNWMDDFEVKLVNYATFSECDCKVHSGFYRSALAIKNATIDSVKYLKFIYPTYSIIATGHSYGAAVAQLIALELAAESVPTQLYNFGQPRVGNAEFAAFANTQLNVLWRFTHYKDVVPHLPPITGFGYIHSCIEVYEDDQHNIRICSDNCEDPEGSDQFPLYKTNGDDHMLYLNHYLSCEQSTIRVE
jgi:predicted lipase